MPPPQPSTPSTPDPDRGGEQFTRHELFAARAANACADAAGAFGRFAAGLAEAAQRLAAERAAEHQRIQQRIEQARRWLRQHPDAS